MKNIIKISQLNNLNNYKITIFCLLISVFFLPTALPISLIFILISITLSVFKFRKLILRNKFFYIYLICIILMTFSYFNSKSIDYQNVFGFDNNLSIIDLANWVPYFICFLGFQYLLKNQRVRKYVGVFLLLGTLPVIFSCISQYWFKWYGPFSTMNNLIIWFQRPIEEGQGVSGLFNNPNYAAIWLTAVWPFSLIYLKNRKSYNFIFLAFSVLIFYFSILTNSRNSFLCILIIIPIILNFKKLNYLKGLFGFSIFVLLIKQLDNLFELNSKLSHFIPFLLFDKLTSFSLDMNSARFEIFEKALFLISERPLFGWGAKTFPHLYIELGGIGEIQHTHNFFLEITHNYGLIVSGIIIFSIFYIVISSYKVIFSKSDFNNIENKSWFASFFVFIIFQSSDFTLYDGKISIFFWIILSGLSGIIISSREENILKNQNLVNSS